MNTWQPIEKAPKDGTHLLLFGPRQWDGIGKIDVGPIVGKWEAAEFGSADEVGWFTVTSNPYRDKVHPTHWMQLPPSPFQETVASNFASPPEVVLQPSSAKGWPGTKEWLGGAWPT